MKVKVLFLLVPALLVADVANVAKAYNKDGSKLNLYSKIDDLHYFSDSKDVDGDQTYMRLGFRGETQVTNQLTGYGQWEYQIQGNSAENENNSWTHTAFAGPRFQDVGSFDYGHNYGAVYDVTSWVDVLPESGGDIYGSDNFTQQRGDGSATYRNTDLFDLADSLNFAVQYRGKGGSLSGKGFISGIISNGRDALRQDGDGAGGSITYDYEGFGIGGATSSSKRTDAQDIATHIGSGNRAETYTGGLKYGANSIHLAVQYTQTYNATRVGSLGWADKAQNFEAAVQYQFNFGLCLSLAYLQSKGKDLDRGHGDEDILKYVDTGATYYFNKDMSTYVDYRIDLLDDNQFTRSTGINTGSIVALGLVYQF